MNTPYLDRMTPRSAVLFMLGPIYFFTVVTIVSGGFFIGSLLGLGTHSAEWFLVCLVSLIGTAYLLSIWEPVKGNYITKERWADATAD
jgi:hypothetical protein